MRTFLIVFVAVIGSSGTAAAELSSEFFGIWRVSVVNTDKRAFPWWREVKYPVTLEISRVDTAVSIRMTDQFDRTCVIEDFLVANGGRDLVFSYCGETKSKTAWAVVQHAKIQDGELFALVSTGRLLFKWRGIRDGTSVGAANPAIGGEEE